MPLFTENAIASPAQRYWDTRWTGGDQPTRWALRRGEAIVEMLRGLRLAKPRILDLGCGTGWFAAKLSEFGCVLGLDPSPGAVGVAQRRYPQLDFRCSSLEEFDLSVDKFDVVVCQEVLPHVEDQSMLLGRIANVLEPGGWLVVATANRFVVERLGDPNWNWCLPPGHSEQHVTRSELKRLLDPRFCVRQIRTVVPIGQAGILRWTNSARLNRALNWVISPARLQAVKEKTGLGYHIVVLARRRD